MEINTSKLERQLLGIQKWIAAGCKGTFNYRMGFGKTYSAILIAKQLIERYGVNEETIPYVIVPSITTKEMWIREFTAHNVLQYKVLTINEVVNVVKETTEEIKCGYLIIDELHRFTSDLATYSLSQHKYSFMLALTGTYPHRCVKLASLFPIVDSISEDEALSKEWIPKSIEYNIAVEFTDIDKEVYVKLSAYIAEVRTNFKDIHKRFNHPSYTLFKDELDLIYSCYRGKVKPVDGFIVKEKGYIESTKVRESVANMMGWTNNLDLTTEYGKDREKNWNPSNIKKISEKFNDYIVARNNLMSNNSCKLNVLLYLLDTLDVYTDKIIIFNESIDFADKLTEAINEKYKEHIAVCYHSDIKSRPLTNPLTNDYYRYVSGASIGLPKMFGKTNLKRDAIEGICSGRYRVLVSVNALNEGFNVESINSAICTSGTTNPIQHEQRTSRAKRIDPFDKAKQVRIYNLYFSDFYLNGKLYVSRDKVKLEQRQNTLSMPPRIITLDELLVK